MSVSQDGPSAPDSARTCLAVRRRSTYFSISMPKRQAICWATGTQPHAGLMCFISTMGAMSCAEGPFGPGFRLRHEDDNSRRYFRWTNALWHLNSVGDLRLADSF